MSEFRQYISVEKLCNVYHISLDEVLIMEEHELIEVTYVEEKMLLDMDEIAKLERYMRLYSDLGVNIQGLAVINDLLDEVERLNKELCKYRKC